MPNIAKWNNKIRSMKGMFYGCSSLKYLSNISKWDTTNVTDMSNIFRECKSLSSLSDISLWNTNNV